MIRKNITIEELQAAVRHYEEETLLSSFSSFVGDDKNLIRFKGRRRDKIVVVSIHKFPSVQLPSLLARVANVIDATPSMSESVEFFTTCRLTSEAKGMLVAMALHDFSLSLMVCDASIMEKQESFKTLWERGNENQPLDETEKSLYDYLSVSNDSADIKNGIYFSLLLLIIYKHGVITEKKLRDEMESRFGRELGDVKKDIEQLRKAGKIRPGKIELTDEEREKIRTAERESKAVEDDFMRRYEELLSHYDINDKQTVFEVLQQLYVVSSKYDYSEDDIISGKTPEDIKEAYNHLQRVLTSLMSDVNAVTEVMSALQQLCSDTKYLQRVGINTAFLNLYRSSRYEDYMKSQTCCVILDTPVLTNFLCVKGGLHIHDDWDDADYQTVKDLAGYKDSQHGKVRFVVPYDYLLETFYEYKKALQITWFNQFNLPIPPETTNIFYNYYLFIKQQKAIYDEQNEDYSFADFAQKMGFPNIGVEHPAFKRRCLAYLQRAFQILKCDYIDEIKETYANFDKIRDTYASALEASGRDKTPYAINADVRQAFYIAYEKRKTENAYTEYYFCSWDKTLAPLRNAVADELLMQRTYSIQTPQALLPKLSFKFFHLAKGVVNDTVFTYAEKEYNVTTKIRSLYDNILIPYFASVSKGNVQLVVSIMNMEKRRWEQEKQEASRMERRTALEDIFLDVIHALPKHQLTSQNLRDLLSNQDMNDHVVSLFQQAFDAKRDKKTFNIVDPLCNLMKQIIVQNDEDGNDEA